MFWRVKLLAAVDASCLPTSLSRGIYAWHVAASHLHDVHCTSTDCVWLQDEHRFPGNPSLFVASGTVWWGPCSCPVFLCLGFGFMTRSVIHRETSPYKNQDLLKNQGTSFCYQSFHQTRAEIDWLHFSHFYCFCSRVWAQLIQSIFLWIDAAKISYLF